MNYDNEPVAWMSSVNGETVYVGYEPADGWLAIPLYTHPAKTPTDEEIDELAEYHGIDSLYETGRLDFARAILRKAQEK
jgi:hypothetical protein